MSGDAIAPFSDTQTIFRKLRGLPENKICFDCPIKNPTWCTIPYGAFVCLGTVLTSLVLVQNFMQTKIFAKSIKTNQKTVLVSIEVWELI